ncbi:Fe-S cluster assembly protein Dre2 [Aspergillus uvarum CBS 121591]|uniref:Fe-S cluster assembly protein Dre2 n=1 Tax=Aspergillus uvarum CBS 121591 TaxID=1448315 RepID=A0A319C7G0_9EURO|nr:Fe-S cluster assembly protein Dre2 [Aspergillus uvarum CBS 121591]PYH79779.1 Fe-S cluster assembly protein Dre2 [Aspergillus uvarum CBS 121591]
MAPSFVTIDTTPDFDLTPPPSVKSINPSSQRILLLAPPSIATHEEKLRDLFTTYDRSTTDLQMLDRIAGGFASLPANTYDLVLVLTDTDGTRRSEALQLLNRNVYGALVPSMKAGAKFQTQDNVFGEAEEREAVLAGLFKTDKGFEKADQGKVFAIPLRRSGKKDAAKKTPIAAATNTQTAPLPSPPTGAAPVQSAPPLAMGIINDDADYDDDDELIDEDELLSEDDLKRPIPPPECQPKKGRRRRACKDCTCGLAARIEAEEQAQREKADKALNVMKLQTDDLNELDFTVQGKPGSCGNCALGDAFRCDGCPFIGLPAFKPGQEVQIMNNVVQL